MGSKAKTVATITKNAKIIANNAGMLSYGASRYPLK